METSLFDKQDEWRIVGDDNEILGFRIGVRTSLFIQGHVSLDSSRYGAVSLAETVVGRRVCGGIGPYNLRRSHFLYHPAHAEEGSPSPS